MVGVDWTRHSVYFGHPSRFWKQRHRLENEPAVDVEAAKTLGDVVAYDSVHLQQAVVNRTSEKVQALLNEEEMKLRQRREKLKILLLEEEEEFAQELAMKQAMVECGYCKQTQEKQKSYEEEIEKEKVIECLKALEREKIAKGMQSRRIDKIRLKALQKAQIEEKRRIEKEEENVERIWHQVLLDDVRRKEQYERDQERRRQQEMLERRLAYDEQIASANRKRREMLQDERERESRRLERMRRKMEQDHYEAQRRKKEQQTTNKVNFTEGQRMKLHRVKCAKSRERQMDDNAVRDDLRAVEEEKRRRRAEMEESLAAMRSVTDVNCVSQPQSSLDTGAGGAMELWHRRLGHLSYSGHKLQMDKKDCIANFNRDRRIAQELEEDRDNIIKQWMKEKENATEEWMRSVEEEKRTQKQKIAEEYRSHIAERNYRMEREREERETRMLQVKRAAIQELQKKLDSANEELRKQLEYRQSLGTQIMDNQRAHLTELMEEETKQRPFTKKANMFKEAMGLVGRDPGRKSTNPVHPFKRVLDSENNKTQLPSINLN